MINKVDSASPIQFVVQKDLEKSKDADFDLGTVSVLILTVLDVFIYALFLLNLPYE